MRRHRNRYGQVACLTILALLSTPGSCQTTGYRTIDDYYGDSVTGQKPVYSEGWNYGPTCSDCLVRPYAAYTFEGSWHDVTASPTDTSPRNVTLTFNGTAIWVYCIIPNYIPYATTLVDLSFQLDGLGLATYYDVPNPNDTYWYNATVFSRTGLSNEVHTLVMVVNGERSASYAAFDWAEYSYGENASASSEPEAVASSSHHMSAAIPGIAVAGSVALLILGCALETLWLRSRRRRRLEATRANLVGLPGGTAETSGAPQAADGVSATQAESPVAPLMTQMAASSMSTPAAASSASELEIVEVPR